MVTLQKDTKDKNFAFQKEFMDNLALLKMGSDSDRIDDLSQRVTTIEKKMDLWEKPAHHVLFAIDEGHRTTRAKRENIRVIQDTMRDCKGIIDRASEILSDWSEMQDMKLQIQYAAVIIGKIDNIKKIDYIQSDDTRKKICTLLRNVIRINVTDAVFTEEQISLLKKGFSLLLSEQLQNKDMLQLNREFLGQKLSTMPAWE